MLNSEERDQDRQIDIMNDLLEGFAKEIQRIQLSLRGKPSLKKLLGKIKSKTLFRSSQRISFFTYSVLYLTQSTLLSQDIYASLPKCSILIQRQVLLWFSKLREEGKDSQEWKLLITMMA